MGSPSYLGIVELGNCPVGPSGGCPHMVADTP